MTVDVYSGDCLKEMERIPSNSVDMALLDPPFGTTKCKWDQIIPLDKMWEGVHRIVKPNGAIVVFSAQPFTTMLNASNLDNFRYDLIWEKPNAKGFLNSKKMPLRAHESISVFYRKPPVFNPQKTYGHARKTTKRKSVGSECYGESDKETVYDSTSRYPRSVQNFSSDTQKTAINPTQKPVALAEWLIKSFTNEGQLIADISMGSGSFGVAATNLNRNFIGIEKNHDMFKKACRRIMLGDTL